MPGETFAGADGTSGVVAMGGGIAASVNARFAYAQGFELGFSFLSAVMPGLVPGNAGTSRNASRGNGMLSFVGAWMAATSAAMTR
jgi:hypothetical protein